MPLLSNRPIDTRFLGLFVGRSGSGKKCAAASFPGLIKYLDFDGRVGGIDGASWVDRSKIDYEPYPPKMIAGQFAAKVDKDLDLFMAQCKQPGNTYKTLYLGSYTGALKGVLAEAVNLNEKSRKIGQVAMAGPQDFGYEATNADNIIGYLRSIPIPNVILSAHIVDRYGKMTDAKGNIIDPYAESVVIGNKLALRDKIAEVTPAFFDHVFEFEKRETGSNITFWVRFRSSLARTSYASLPNGWVDITGKDFYQYLQSQIKKEEVKKDG